MKKTLLLTALLLAMTATIALAGGVNFNWGSVCWTEAPVASKTFACNVNTSTAAFQWPMTVSFAIDTDMADLVGIEITLEGQSAAVALPDWWKVGQTGSGDCRQTMFAYTSDKTLVEDATCVDWTAGQAFNVFGYTYDTNRAHVNGGCAIDASFPYAATAGQEYYGGQFLLKNSKTVGTGSCTGCSTPFIMGLFKVVAAGLDGRRDDLMNPLGGEQVGNQCLRWNDPTASLLCGVPIPAKNTTWGQVKSLYR